ncbi:MAG: polyprenol monophosphomannose synthase [Candidatus Nanopelagicaceae bacterium]|jgi:dolichol-phosphate mannosyltransferase
MNLDHSNFLVLIPTYNERESIGALLKQLTESQFKVLLIDDNSPDGTSDYVKSLNFVEVEILERKKKDGLGNAYKAGIKFALNDSLDWRFDYLISMDGDGSHQVTDLINMVRALEKAPNANLVLGSRWIPGGGIRNWNSFRIWLSKAGTRYARWALKLPINDLTGGFRIYSKKTLQRIDLDQIESNGYSYQIEMAFAVNHLKQFNLGEVLEVPITFIERESGVSKMSSKVVLEAIWKVTKLGLGLRLRPNADKLHYVK